MSADRALDPPANPASVPAMVRRARLLAALSLSILLVSFSAAQGLMRGPSEFGQTTLVICTGHGLETITLDPSGTPVPDRPDCPDTSLNALTAATSTGAIFVATLTGVQPPPVTALKIFERSRVGHAPRAPPILF